MAEQDVGSSRELPIVSIHTTLCGNFDVNHIGPVPNHSRKKGARLRRENGASFYTNELWSSGARPRAPVRLVYGLGEHIQWK